MKHVFKDFPLAMHKQAFKAAEAASCAAEQGKFWELHDRLFANQNALGPEDLLKYAEALGLDMPKFKGCLDSEKYASEIKKDIAVGKRTGITGTPAFLLGYIKADGKMLAVKILTGAQPYSAFKDSIDSLLSPPKQ